ncbi:hypothetical protein BaRGS_00021441 [Batillaria attramentaria]|uniref:Gamma-tubulin complex component n=1 Tax=Batillaria attramentaria TaxID=370345 RepID=A0ABD0KJV4_9CAEN
MARMKEETDKLTRQLISRITGFEVDDENFALCLQFAQSNIRFHRFLDVDSHRVQRQLDGLYTKLSVHSLEDRAATLRTLVTEFLDEPIFEGRDVGKTDTHYAVLSLLCLLADSPTNASYVPREPEVVEEPVDTFDWASHLLDGEKVFVGYSSDTSSEEDWKIAGSTTENEETESDYTSASPARDLSAHMVQDVQAGCNVSVDTTLEQGRQAEEWLSRNIMVQYWKGQSESEAQGHHAASNLLRDWASYQVRSGEVYAMVGQRVVTEYQLIREVLWMLSGVEKLFLFELTDSGFRLRDNVCLSHLTGPSLESCLSQMTLHANRVSSLQSFISDVVANSCRGGDTGESRVSQTYQAFADSLARILGDFRQHLSRLEKKVAEQDQSDCVTLSSLLSHLAPWLPTLTVVWEVFVAGVSLLMRLLLETSRPYLDIVGQWISEGQLLDPSCQFVLQRNESIQCLDETFWERALTLNTTTVRHERSDTSLSSAGLCAEEDEWGREFQDVVEAAPRFLQPVMRDIVLTGKSMELLQALGRLPEVVSSDDEFGRGKSLYQMFVDSLKDVLGTCTPQTACTQETTLSASLYVEYVHMENCVTGTKDQLLKINFQAIFSTLFQRKAAENAKDPYDLSSLGCIDDACVGPIGLLFQRCLYPHIRRRYEHVCSRLLEILKREYHLMDFLASVQHFYLMSAGDAMFDFYTQIFDKMRHQEQWRDTSSLTLALQDALQAHHAHDVSRLSVSVEPLPKARERSAVGVTDCIRLNFDVPWPVDVVVNSKCQDLYNQVFQFLLQIKRAKYGLDQLRFADLDKAAILQVSTSGLGLLSQEPEETMSRSERLHRMHTLRFRLAYFVNSLHNYIMTRILHSTGLEFAEEIKKARDLEQVIEVHARYVRTIHERCLLHKKLTFLKEAVTKVLNLTVTFAMRWDQGVDEVSGKTLVDMETEFSRCIQFLASFLNNIIKRGSFPHVEPLAYALVTSLPNSGRG